MAELQVVSTPNKDYIFTNCVYVNEVDFRTLAQAAVAEASKNGELLKIDERKGFLVQVTSSGSFSKKTVLHLRKSNQVEPQSLALNSLQRGYLQLQLDALVPVSPFFAPANNFILNELEFSVSLLRKGRATKVETVDCKKLAEEVLRNFDGQVVERGMKLAHYYNSSIYVQLQVTNFKYISLEGENTDGTSAPARSLGDVERGQIMSATDCSFTKVDGDTSIKLTGRAIKSSANRMVGINFEKLGIGGLDKEFTNIFRRAFASRIYPPEVVARLGTKHVRGLMLYGPPGCGKTLIARQISKVLQGAGGAENAREPKIVSGPEVLNKYVGGSEEKIRELFKEAEEEQNSAGDESELHVIIFDEIDAICKSRGSSRDGTGVGDSVVNQLLAKIDGVNSLNNILLIGMTNRLDMIDSALLRPGRFEVHIEIGLPDEHGRTQILNIHTSTMRNSNSLDGDVSIPQLATRTKNFSGAEIEGLVKSAASFAFLRHVAGDSLTNTSDIDNLKVGMDDFERALGEVKPKFGVQGEDELELFYRNGIVNYGQAFARLNETMLELAQQVEVSTRTPLLSVLLSGPKGAGKSALIAKMAADSGFPFVKMITPDSMIGMSDQAKCNKIVGAFEDAYKSPLSLIIIDDLERLLDYVLIGPRFSNSVLQALIVLINKPPPRQGRKLMVVGTTAIPHLLEEMGLTQVFNVKLDIPQLESESEIEIVLRHMLQVPKGESSEEHQPVASSCSEEEIKLIADNCKKPITVKKFLQVLEMARQGSNELTCNRFMECFYNVGY